MSRTSAVLPDKPTAGQGPRFAGQEEELPQMSLLQHLEELRRRVLRSLVALGIAFVATWYLAPMCVEFLSRPIQPLLPEGHKLAFFAPTEAFVLYLKVSGLMAVFAVAPYILAQVWGFIAPGLYKRERRFALPFIFFGTFFFLAGGAFAYYVALPFALEFLVNFGSDQFEAVISAKTYFSFLIAVILGLGLMFELPILIFLLSWIGLVTPRFLMRHFRWAVLLIFIAAAIITPTPDVFNLCLFAVPTLGLYLLGVGAAALIPKRQRLIDPVEESAEA